MPDDDTTPAEKSLRPDIQAAALELHDPEEDPIEHDGPSLRKRADEEDEPS